MTIDLAAIAAEFTGDGDGPPLLVSHRGPLWRWQSKRGDAPAAWFFITISGPAAATIAGWTGIRGSFGSVKVEARIGATCWRTSLFPSKDPPGFLLPMKASVRKAEGIAENDPVNVELRLTAESRR